MTDLREKVARAIYAKDWEDPRSCDWDDTTDFLRNRYMDLAPAAIDAVLEALKEPSPLMLEAAAYAMPGVTKEANDENERKAWQLFRIMIQAFTRDHYLSALAEEDGKEL